MRCIGLLMVAGVIGFSNSAEGQTQVLDKANRGVLWIDTGGEVPENAVRVRVEKGRPLCRGAHSEPKAKKWWRDIGVYDKGKGACHTLRNKKNLKFQEEFYFLVPEPMSAEVEELLAETDEFIGEVDLLLGGDDSVIDKWEGDIVEEHEERIKAEAMEGMVPVAVVLEELTMLKENNRCSQFCPGIDNLIRKFKDMQRIQE